MQRRPTYIYETEGWPDFTYDRVPLQPYLDKVRLLRDSITETLNRNGFVFSKDRVSNLNICHIVRDIVGTMGIEGETVESGPISRAVRSRLDDFNSTAIPPAMRRTDPGIVEVLVDATRNYDQPFTKERIFDWHRKLFPTGKNNYGWDVIPGAWRDGRNGQMEIVEKLANGDVREVYVPPPSETVDFEMSRYLAWFNGDNEKDLIIKSGISHLWFESIHPLEDGNGRIGRAASDMMLARADNNSERLFSLSFRINKDKGGVHGYYDALAKVTGNDSLDVTLWLVWHLRCLNRALRDAEHKINGIIITETKTPKSLVRRIPNPARTRTLEK